MKTIFAIFKKEIRLYFNSLLAHIFIAVFLATSGFLFLQDFFLISQASMRGFFGFLPWIFMILIPALCMRLLAEEKKMGTIELVLTCPVQDAQLVLGKFLAALATLTLCLVLSLGLPIVVNAFGNPDNGVIFANYFGTIFLTGFFAAIAIFASSLSDNQIIAFILAAVICFAFLLVGDSFFADVFPGSVKSVLIFLGVQNHFFSISRGVFDSRDFLYFLSMTGFFLFLTVKNLESRKLQ